ncbi:CoA-binding protein [Carboxylicivirga linearis]|uniref:CoA-binding protein n=1 Tax=Carboxylicivirga linearis TaxID=1628157 RepID=A0ABS5JVB9_9BACT|nr:CoA-binding protein [Carboxylicivirga linearis]MBS2098832.1 CoA-binding protein [Carboxylicivirga linearis]
MKVTKDQINSFFNAESIAIAGVSRNEKKFGRMVFSELKKNGYQVIPVNPSTAEIDGQTCYSDIDNLPENIESLLIATPKNQTDEVLRKAINKGIKNIWVQQYSNTENTLKIAEEYDKEIIHKKCIFMFAEPVAGIHKFHKTLMKVFGKLPN